MILNYFHFKFKIVYKMLSDDLMNTYASVITFTNQLQH